LLDADLWQNRRPFTKLQESVARLLSGVL